MWCTVRQLTTLIFINKSLNYLARATLAQEHVHQQRAARLIRRHALQLASLQSATFAHVDGEPCATALRGAGLAVHPQIVHTLAVRAEQRIVAGTGADAQHIRADRLQTLGDRTQVVDARAVDVRQQVGRTADIDQSAGRIVAAAEALGGQTERSLTQVGAVDHLDGGVSKVAAQTTGEYWDGFSKHQINYCQSCSILIKVAPVCLKELVHSKDNFTNFQGQIGFRQFVWCQVQLWFTQAEQICAVFELLSCCHVNITL